MSDLNCWLPRSPKLRDVLSSRIITPLPLSGSLCRADLCAQVSGCLMSCRASPFNNCHDADVSKAKMSEAIKKVLGMSQISSYLWNFRAFASCWDFYQEDESFQSRRHKNCRLKGKSEKHCSDSILGRGISNEGADGTFPWLLLQMIPIILADHYKADRLCNSPTFSSFCCCAFANDSISNTPSTHWRHLAGGSIKQHRLELISELYFHFPFTEGSNSHLYDGLK